MTRTFTSVVPASIRPAALVVTLAAVWGQAQAQIVPPTSGGQLLQQVQPPSAPAPSSNTGLRIEQTSSGQESSGGAAFEVRRIEVTGNTLLPPADIQTIVEPEQGKTLKLAELNELAARITQLYHAKGYPLSRAYVPAQTVQNGVVTIAVLEARYGSIKLDNTSRVDTPVIQATLAPLKSGEPITEHKLNRSLLLLGDIPGVVSKSTLRPGEQTGTSDLGVDVTPGAPYSGNIGLDNAGSRYTGRARLAGNFNLNNPLHRGDQLSLSGITSGRGMNYGRIGYQYLLGGEGTRLGVAYSALQYKLLYGGFESLGAHGTAQVASLWLNQPVIREVNANLYAQLGYDHKSLRDAIDINGTHNNRHTDGLNLTLAGDARDAHGITNYSATLGLGRVRFDDAAAKAMDAAGPDTQGTYGRLLLSASRLQQLSSANALYLGVTGQLANTNLDPSDQFVLGGPGNVRAYDVGAIAGSQGAFATAEFRHNFSLQWPGQWQAVAFVDAGTVQIYKSTFAGSGTNHASIYGAGLGLNWFGANGWAANAVVAAPVGSTPRLIGHTASARLWIQVLKGF